MNRRDRDMGHQDVVIVANGGSNIASLQFALQRLGIEAQLSADAARIASADRVILPGVGAAADAMQRLRELHLDSAIVNLKQPVLGICLGMQILFESSQEGDARCLGIIPGKAVRFENRPGFCVPHMGWNTLVVTRDSPLLEGIGTGAYGYFVHSFAVPVGPETIASTDYSGPFSSCVQSANFYGVQFHPERSARLGATILSNFLRMN